MRHALDTPRAWDSRWIDSEINTANGQLIPILPVCCLEDCHQHGSRFDSLHSLRRYVELGPSDWAKVPLEEDVLARILEEMEIYLLAIYRRKLSIPRIVEKQFASEHFDWNAVDDAKCIYKSVKNRQDPRLLCQVLSHCSFYDGVYLPALQVFIKYIHSAALTVNYRLFIHGDVMPKSQTRAIYNRHNISGLIILHHGELLFLLRSGFRELP